MSFFLISTQASPAPAPPSILSCVARVHGVFFLSGLAALGYEIAWTRQFALGLGHEMPSLLAVVTAFFGGLSLGAWWLDRRLQRTRTPGRWYARLEALAGAWALAGLALVPWLNDLALGLGGLSQTRRWLVAFALPFFGLLPATFAMGATFPAMEALASRLTRSGRTVGGLYAANTAGAVAGTLLTTFVLVPTLGFSATLTVLALVSLLCAAAIAYGPARDEEARETLPPAAPGSPARVRATLVCTGLLGIGYQVLCVRVMNQVLEGTVYTFAAALTVYLAGTAFGAALWHRFFRRAPFGPALNALLLLLAMSCLAGVSVLRHGASIYAGVRDGAGAGLAGSVLAEAALAAAVFAPPTLLMGATFSHLAQEDRRRSGGVGKAFAVNTLGACAAPFVFGVVLLPWLGARDTLLVLAAGYLPLLPLWRPRHLVPLAAAPALVPLLPADLVLVSLPEGSRRLAYREGVMAAVAVVEDEAGWRTLKVDNRFDMGGTAGAFAERRMGHVPLLLHPAPERVLYLGLGTGNTARAATAHEGLDVDGVELVPEVIELMPLFRLKDFPSPQPRSHAADARRFVRTVDKRYDVVVADLFHPGRDGAGALYTREHFAAIRDRLAPDGLFCQWLPLHQLDAPTLRLILRTFLSVFPDARAFVSHFNVDACALGLVHGGPRRYPSGWYRRRDLDPFVEPELERLALGSELRLFGCLLAGPRDLESFAGPGPLNTDDFPRVVFEAPRAAYRAGESAVPVVDALLDGTRATASDIVAPAYADLVRRLDLYLRARNRYLRGLLLDRRGERDRALETMLQAAALSPDFRTAYETCLVEAGRLGATPMARRILQALQRIDPRDGRAATAYRELFGAR